MFWDDERDWVDYSPCASLPLTPSLIEEPAAAIDKSFRFLLFLVCPIAL